jgi:hypothetical protein
VARANTETARSEYYPPRARWYGPLFSPWHQLHRLLHLERIHLPVGFSAQQFILSLLVPGYAFFAAGRRVLGRAFLIAYCTAAALFIVALGYPLGGLGYGLMISVHASGIILLESNWFRNQLELGTRLLLALGTLLAVWLLIYSPLTGVAQRHWFMPLRVRGNVVIMHRTAGIGHIQRGDWVMYALRQQYSGDAHAGGAVLVQAGANWGPVLALAGDRVAFSTNSVSVNGIEQPLRPHMPTVGELVVPEKHWFVWPELDIYRHGNVNEANLSDTMLQLAMVSEIEFAGKPFKHWFWRKQILP